MKRQFSRRSFTKAGMAAALGLTAFPATRVLGANDRVRLGVIGTGNRGRQVMEFFLQQQDCEIAAVCDVSKSTMDEANAKLLGGKASTQQDFRQILDRQDIDAVLIATPDHWHALHDDHGLPGRERCVLRKAVVEDDPRGAENGRGGSRDGSRGPGRHTPPLGPVVRRRCEADCLQQAGQDHGGSRLRHHEHVSAGDRQGRAERSTRRISIGRCGSVRDLRDRSRPRSRRSSSAGGISTPLALPTTVCTSSTSCAG